MPLYIGDYLADTMHLNTEQHGAYLLMLFHLWRRGSIPDDDAALARTSGLPPESWQTTRPVLAGFFQIENGVWRHRRVDRERERVEAKSDANARRSQAAADERWQRRAVQPIGNDSGAAQALLEETKPQSQSQTESKAEAKIKTPAARRAVVASSGSSSHVSREKGLADGRFLLFREILSAYWQAKNLACPEMPWQIRDSKALLGLLRACPGLTEAQFRAMVANRARSPVAHGDRVFLWIGNVTRFQEEMSIFNKPLAAGVSSYASRAEINRDAVLSSVSGAIALAREHSGGAGHVGAEPAGLVDRGVLADDGAGFDGRALALSRGGD